MALGILSYPNPCSSTPMTNAYGWLSFIALDLFQGTGRVVFNINPTADDWDKPPVAQVSVSLGQTLTPATPGDPNATPPVPATEAVTFDTLQELMADPEFAAAYRVIGAKIYQQAAAKVPAFAGSSQV